MHSNFLGVPFMWEENTQWSRESKPLRVVLTRCGKAGQSAWERALRFMQRSWWYFISYSEWRWVDGSSIPVVSVFVMKTFSFRLLRLRTDNFKPSISCVSSNLMSLLRVGPSFGSNGLVGWLMGVLGMGPLSPLSSICGVGAKAISETWLFMERWLSCLLAEDVTLYVCNPRSGYGHFPVDQMGPWRPLSDTTRSLWILSSSLRHR